MLITRVIYNGNVDVTPEVLTMLRDRLQEIIASELSTSEAKLNNDSIELVFEKGHPLNRGKDLKILIDGNDLPERTENLQGRGERIASKVGEMLSVFHCSNRTGFVYVMLQAGGLGKFNF